MSIFSSPRFLSRVMWADAASCAATGLLQLGAVDAMADLTGLPRSLLLDTGVFFLLYALAAAWMARRAQAPRRLIGWVAVGNLGWAIGCGVLLASGALALTPLGSAWLVAQAVAVLVLADLQWMGLRSTRTATLRVAV